MNRQPEKAAADLIEFIDKCPTAYHAAGEIARRLAESGFTLLEEGEGWNLLPGGRYWVSRNGSAVAAFVVGSGDPAEGFLLAGVHTDSPGLKIKERSESLASGAVRHFVEIYGGPILSTWLDRDLSLAGAVMVKRKSGAERVLVDLRRPVAVVPNLAIHLNREINDGFKYNPQNHMAAILAGSGGEAGLLKRLLAEEAGCLPEEVGEGDLFLYSAEKGRIAGGDSDLFSSSRIDNLAGCHAVLEAVIAAENPRKTAVALFFDNEEVGNTTLQGASSSFLTDLLDRITTLKGGGGDAVFRARANSFSLSIDGAHAVHPNFADKHDSSYAPLLNGGPVIKINAGFRYATTGVSAARFESLCEAVNVPVQRFAMRSDLPCGTTIGPISSSLTGIPTVDVGIPMWGMHSIRETAGVEDQEMMIRVLKGYFR